MGRALALALAFLIVLSGCTSFTGTQNSPNAEVQNSPTNLSNRSNQENVSPTSQSPSGSNNSEPNSSSDSRLNTPNKTFEKQMKEIPETNGTEQGSSNTSNLTVYQVDIIGEGLPVNASLVFSRVQMMLGTNESPPTVLVRERPITGARYFGGDNNTFHKLMIRDVSSRESGTNASEANTANAYYKWRNRVYVTIPENTTFSEREAQRFESTLSHEFFHAVQFEKPGVRQAGSWLGRNPSNDERRAWTSVVEGTAMYVQSRYTSRYLNITPLSSVYKSRYLETSTVVRYFSAPYYFGLLYTEGRINSTQGVWSIYTETPRTTEQVIHNYSPSEEPPKPLEVTVMESNSTWGFYSTDTMGEMFTRIALTGGLNNSYSARGAAGWGNDTLLKFSKEGKKGYAWVLRWDDKENATEFKGAFGEYLEVRAIKNGEIWTDGDNAFRFERPSDQVVVIFAGHPSFVRNVTVSGSNTRVRVSV